ncbi:hypothetical protein GCM10028832_39630 [Streptomyces sparsus]
MSHGTPPGYGAGPPHAPAPPRRHWTVPLAAAALTVAALAGVGVYAAVTIGGDKGAAAGPDGARPGGADPDTSATDPSPSPDSTPPTASGDPSPDDPGQESAADNAVPEQYLGTWRASFESTGGTSTRVLTITEGRAGEQVMTLAGRGPGHDCRWAATLRTAGPPLELGPSSVTAGSPADCSPGQWSRLTMPNDRSLVRELVGSGGEPLTYTKVR